MHKAQRYLDWIFSALIGFITCIAFLSFSPYRVPDPHRDSGIFLNIGAEITRGKVLYQQAILDTLTTDLQTTPPLYIADTRDAAMPLLEGRSGSACLSGSQVEDARLLDIIAFVCSHYEFDRAFENIMLYKLRGAP